jgi:thymidylate synthase
MRECGISYDSDRPDEIALADSSVTFCYNNHRAVFFFCLDHSSIQKTLERILNMEEIFVMADTLPQAYHKALLQLDQHGSLVDCPDYSQQQKECSMTVVIKHPLQEPRISRLIIGGHRELQQYEMEVLDGILDFKIGDGTCWEYTYHARYAWQMPFIYEELARNPLSRRAIINIRDYEVDTANADPACMQSIQFFIRDKSLHMKILFRSNDLPEAFFFNAFALIRLQERVAGELGVEVGTYTHRSNSMHCYEKDFKLMNRFVEGIRTKSEDELTHSYRDFYKELMEEEIPVIMRQVELLKKNMPV